MEGSYPKAEIPHHMKAYAYPPHRSLSRECAQHILTQYEDHLPDLTGLTILVPTSAARAPLRQALQELAAGRGISGLLLPDAENLRSWVLGQAREPLRETALSELLDFASLLSSSADSSGEPGSLLNIANPAEPWAVANELLGLFELLSLNDTVLPEEQGALRDQLQEKYGIRGRAPEQLDLEAGIVFQLWNAWNSGSSGTLEHYRNALRTVQVPENLQGLYVCGYEDLSRLEMESLRRVADQVPVWVFTRTYHLLSELSPEIVEEGSPPDRAQALHGVFDLHGGQHLRARAEECAQEHPDDSFSDWLRIFCAEHSELHVHGIDIQIRQWLREGHRDIGLITEDRKVARRVRALLERAGIGIRDYSGWALSTTSAATAIDRWLTCLREGFPHQAFLDLLKSPFVRPCPDINQSRVVGYLERILREKSYFQQTLQQSRTYLQSQPEPDETARSCLEILDAVAQATDIWKSLPEPLSGKQYFDALHESLDILGCTHELRKDEAGLKILSTLRETVFAIRHNQTKLSIQQWHALLYRALEQHNYAPEVSSDSVTLVSLNHAHLCEFKHLIVAGMDIRHYPRPPAISFLFNDNVREKLGLSTTAHHQKLELQRFQTLVLAADQVLFTRQTYDEGEPQIESPWLGQIRLFQDLAYGSSLQDGKLDQLARHPDTWVAPESAGSAEEPDWQMPSPSIPVEMVPERISARGHQTLIDCPYQFFSRYVLHLREQEPIDEGLTHLDFGNFVHKCLAAFYFKQPPLPGPWDRPLPSSDHDKARVLLLEIGEALLRTESRYAPFAEEIRPQWRFAIEKFLEQEPAAGYEAVQEIEQQKEKQISDRLCLYGIIDRIDRGPDNQYILTDYKTGSLGVQFKRMPLGEEVQLISYALIVDSSEQVIYRSLKKTPKDIVSLGGDELKDLVQQVRDRLLRMHQAIRGGSLLPAHGDKDSCKRCSMEGICRRQMWQDSAPSGQNAG